MVFASLTFLYVFLPLNLLGYFALHRGQHRNLLLIVSSLAFYAWGEPVWISLLLLSSAIDYLHGQVIERTRGTRWPKLMVSSSLVLNLSLLGVFKYSGFVCEAINDLFGSSLQAPAALSLPIGISFYTFQTISYTIDVYRGEVAAQRSFFKFLLYVSSFHQLVAGPIVRYSHVAREIDHRQHSLALASEGVTRFCAGLFKKVCIANVAGALVVQTMAKPVSEISVAEGWFGLIMFSLQIYFDFSGYSDMAIGLGRICGFHYRENFNHPYIARSATDFWRRWHISLGSFFRDYLYIPLGGKRRRVYRNLLIVWALTGLWHGASWNFMFWGLYFGVLISLERLFLQRVLDRLPGVVGHLYLLFAVVIGWALFYFEDLDQLVAFLQLLFGATAQPGYDPALQSLLQANAYWLVLALGLCTPIVPWVRARIEARANRSPQGTVWSAALGRWSAWFCCCCRPRCWSAAPTIHFSTSGSEPVHKIPQIINVALFGATLLGLGSLLGLELARSSEQPEISEQENRTLAPLPQFNVAAIIDGSFMAGVDAWIADHFTARQQFMDLHFWLEAKRGFHGEDEVVFYAVDIDTDAELEPLADDKLLSELELEPLTDDNLVDELELDEPAQAEPAEPSSIVKTGGIVVADGRAMQLFVGGPKGSRGYAKVINKYAKALHGKATVYSLIVPTAQTFYLPESYQGRVRHEPPNISATSAMLDPSVVAVDVVSALTGHQHEYIYFRTDHHWTALGAYYAYLAFCQVAGFSPIPLDAMEHGTITPFRGSLYRYTRDQKLHRQPDYVEYWVPPGEIEVARGGKAKPKPDNYIRRESKGYGVFLGGDHALLIATSDSDTGRRGLVIKNSYGNPFAVFLAAHYDTLLIVDYRKFAGSVLDLVEHYQITDLIIINGAITSNAKTHIARLAHLLKGD